MIHDTVLVGPDVRLEPLGPEHAADLLPLIDAAAWFGFTTPTPTSTAALAEWIDAAVATPGRLAFVVRSTPPGAPPDSSPGEVRGTTSFYDLDRALGRVEIGHTLYGRPWWGGRTNPATKLLLLTHAFDTWGLRRVALRADARNMRSLAAIARLGATREGVLRQHRVAADGTVGDTVYFSVLADEWPRVRDGLHRRLARP
ncbi:GNAT family N-acetyltransferase [Luteimicrobium subarcticum]|uniref:GNAT family N-acetyltransferase n=1 Tax=Luteimicrobium subarcticum TaxID=620910 RepID=UPI000C23F7BA|nr:GNAT family protein [Luteimicrobium subarcticum]